MKINQLILFPFVFLVFNSFCTKENEDITPVPEFSEYELKVISYFKEIALGFEFGDASEITRKWNSAMKIFVGGTPSVELLTELETIKNEINNLATDDFQMEIVNDSALCNYYIFFGTGQEFAEIYPAQSDYVDENWGLFYIFWNGANQFQSGYMYVDIDRANTTEQKHLLREELTQSLGLAKDSPRYMESIFQSAWTTTTTYAPIDEDLIRLLYHPDMSVGLNTYQVDEVLKDILGEE